MSDLAEFRAGFHDGWSGTPRDKSRGGVYQRAYKAGMEAAERDMEIRSTEVKK